MRTNTNDPDSTSAAALAEATPEGRDRYVDLLRALSIAVVVIGHWLIAIVTLRDGRFTADSGLDVIPGAWATTWVLQVMPLFFFVGGFSNLTSWESSRRRGEGYAGFLRARLSRLLRPTAVFVAAWMVAATGLALLGADDDPTLRVGMESLAKPLWFLAVYVLIVALAPAMLALHRRAPVAAPFAMVLAAGATDAVRLGAGWAWFGYLNFAFVWLFAHQVGFLYADGRLVAAGRRAHLAMAACGIAAVAILTNIGVYAPSLVGTSSRLASNNTPPSVVIVAHSVWLIGLAMLARPAATRWLRGKRAWTAVIVANSMIMTVFLWHITAMVLASMVALPLGFPQPRPGSIAWWALRPAWIAILGVVLVPFVLALARFERPQRRAPRAIHPALGALGVTAFVLALAGFATNGFAGVLEPANGLALTPLRSAGLMLAGAAALAGYPRRRCDERGS